ncbi:MAG: signal recognition particle-docking protein FtsY [Candidatus Handelsmanbacteria bacterium]|nr:signal recognition particle-docking protein FtsY [Candidatus Handelsmanbacteria bacterium]
MLGRLLDKLNSGLSKTREALADKIATVVGSGGRLDEDTLEELEAVLIQADVGMETAAALIEELRQRARQQRFKGNSNEVMALLKEHLAGMLESQDQDLPFAELPARPYTILVVGVNGVGKTTTIGKLAKRYAEDGHKVLIAACDTFRAAAVPQLEIWAERAGVEIVRAQQGADPAAVAFDALGAAKAREVDVLIVDTAGRLHTKVNLMEELKKIRRSLAKQDPGAPHETLLVLDATTGQNTLNQARQFHEATELTGLVLTKLDGTAKGGIALALRRELGIPVKLIGVGEGLDDLQPFEHRTFVEAMLGAEPS